MSLHLHKLRSARMHTRVRKDHTLVLVSIFKEGEILNFEF